MSAFLFTGWTSEADPARGLVDACRTLILHSCEEAQARAWFEGYLERGGRAEGQSPRTIERVVASPIVDTLFTEDGAEPLDWSLLNERAEQALAAGEDAYEQQGYWADCNALLPPGQLPPDLDALQRRLPEDVRTGLNWSVDAQNFFLVSALVLPRFAPEPEPDYDALEAEGAADTDETSPRTGEAPFPELAEKEATGIVRARNAVVAAWRWRRYAVDTPLAGHPIRVDSWCSVVGPSAEDT